MFLLLLTTLAAPQASLSFDEALGLAAEAPVLQGSKQALVKKRELDRKISPLTLNPILSVLPGYRLFKSNDREPELIAELAQPWNVAGHGGARKRTVALEEQVIEVEVRARALERRLAAARGWIDLWGAQRVHAAAERELTIADDLQKRIERAVALGAATRADLADTRAFTAEAGLAVLAAEGEVYERGVVLSRDTARLRAEALAASGELPDPPLPPPASWSQLAAGVEALPGVAMSRVAERAERARFVEERAARGTVLQLGVALQRDAPGGLVLSGLFRVTPSLFDRGEREAGVLAANAERLNGEQRSALISGRAELAIALHEVEHTGEVMLALRDRLVPASREGADARRRLFSAGEGTLLEVLQTERLAVAAEARLERARALNAWARVKLWLLLTAMHPEARP